jgi:hypothetical protein
METLILRLVIQVKLRVRKVNQVSLIIQPHKQVLLVKPISTRFTRQPTWLNDFVTIVRLNVMQCICCLKKLVFYNIKN